MIPLSICAAYQSEGSTPWRVQESIAGETSLRPSISAPASGNFSSPRNSIMSQPGSMIPKSEDNLAPFNSRYLEIREQYVNRMGQPIDVKASLMPTPPVLVMECEDNSTNYHETGNPNSEAAYASITSTASAPPHEKSVPALKTKQPDSESNSSLIRSDSNVMLERALLPKTHRKFFCGILEL